MKAYADCIINELRRKKPRWDLIEFYPKCLFSSLSDKKNLFSKIIDLINRYLYYPYQAKGIVGDIYHIIDHGNSLLVKFIDKNKVVITCHDVIPYLMAKGYFKGIKKPPLALKIFNISMKYLRRARYIFADSENTRKDLIEGLNVESSKLIAIKLASFYPFKKATKRERQVYRNEIGVDSKTLVILHVGEIFFYKNHERILKVLSKLTDKLGSDRWIFYRIGRKYPGNFIVRNFGERNIEKIREVGTLSYEELGKYYNAADVLFFPSLYEGFGMPVLEAMQCGLPVITSEYGSLKEVGGDAVKYVDPYNIENMLGILFSVLKDNNLREEMRQKGFAQAEHFSWDNTLNLMIPYYEIIGK